MRTASVACAAWLSLFGPGFAACDPPTVVRFPTGASGTDVRGEIDRPHRDCFTIDARQAQTLAVTHPTTRTPNFAIQIYRPPWHVGNEDGVLAVTATALKGAEDGTDATEWRGKLPVSGNYLLVVGPIAGNAAYDLHIEIH